MPRRGITDSRPIGPVVLNRDHPSAYKLATFFLFGADGAAYPRDIVSGYRLPSVVNAPVLAGDPTGLALECNTTNVGVYTSQLPETWKLTVPCTMLVGVRRLGSMGTNVTIAGGYYSLPQTAPYVTWGFFEADNLADGIGMYANNGGASILSPSLWGLPSAPLPLGEYHVWAAVFDANASQRLYRDGVLVASSAVNHTGVGYVGTSTFGFGDSAADGRSPAMRYSHGAMWGRALSDAEIWALANPPSRLDLVWQKRRTFFVPTGGGGSVYNQTLTLSATTTKTASGQLTMAPAVSLSAGGGAAQNGPTTMALLASMTARLEQVASAGLTQQVTTALALLGAQVVNGVLTITPSGTLATALTSSQSSAYQLRPSVTLTPAAGLAASVQSTLALALTLASPASLVVGLVGGTHNLALTVGLQAALAEALAASLNQSVALAAGTTVVPTPSILSTTTIGLLAQAAQSVSGGITLSASVLLSLLDGITSSLIGQSYSASTSLGVQSGLSTSLLQTMAANLLLTCAANIAEIAQTTCHTAVALGLVGSVTSTLTRQINAVLSLQLSAQLLETVAQLPGGGPEIITLVALQLRAAALVDLGLTSATLRDVTVH